MVTRFAIRNLAGVFHLVVLEVHVFVNVLVYDACDGFLTQRARLGIVVHVGHYVVDGAIFARANYGAVGEIYTGCVGKSWVIIDLR